MPNHIEECLGFAKVLFFFVGTINKVHKFGSNTNILKDIAENSGKQPEPDLFRAVF